MSVDYNNSFNLLVEGENKKTNNNPKFFFLIIFLTIVFVGFHLLHPLILGTDSYYFLNSIKNHEFPSTDATPILAKHFILKMPLDLVWIKIFLGILMLLSTIILVVWATSYSKNNSFLAGVIVFASPLWVLSFVKFEDDVFSYPFLILSNYFLVRGVKENNFLFKLISLALILFSTLFWKGAWLYLIAWSLSYIPALIIGVIYVLLHPILLNKILSNIFYIMPGNIEATPFIGLFYIFFLWVGLRGIKKEFLPQLLFWVVLGTISAKFMFHAIPFLAIASFIHLNKLPVSKQWLFVLISVFLTIGLGISFVTTQIPNNNQLEAIDFAIQKSNDLNLTLKNQWDLGHLINFKGGEAFYAFSPPQQKDYNNSITVTNELLNCRVLKQFGNSFVYRC